MQYNLEEVRVKVGKFQNSTRFEHTIGVMYTAASLAMCHREDIERSLLAGLLHDCAKGFTYDEQISLCKNYGIELSDGEKACPDLIHAKLGEYLAKTDYSVSEQAVLDAIRWHTTGRPNMTTLEKIIYIADYIEPNRNKAPNLAEIRHLAYQSIDECVLVISEATLGYLRARGGVIDKMTEETYLYYKELLEK